MRLIFYILVSMVTFSSCAQAKQVIKNSYSYLLVTHAGMIAVDDNGNPRSSGVDSSHIIYIETPATVTPVWDDAWINNKSYSITASPVSQKTVQVGFLQNDEPVIIKPSAGNKLWRINVGEKIKNKKVPDTAAKQRSPNSIIVEGRIGNKKFTHLISNETLLRPIQGE
jgi:hypothetical protein